MKSRVLKMYVLVALLPLLCQCNLLDNRGNGAPENENRSETIEEIGAKAIEIRQALDYLGRNDIWVHGYIIGGDLTAKGIKFEGPFSSATNIAIAPLPDCSVRDSCMSVSLPQGKIRNELNLITNHELIGQEIYIKGEIVVAYYGLVGIKPLRDYRLAAHETLSNY